jgi:ribose-phosphate pyrophosphokinase
MHKELVLFSGNANRACAEATAAALGEPLGDARVGRFSDGETRVEIDRNVRGRDVYLFQSTCPPVNEHLMELLVMAEACHRASAGRITAVMPYFGYARQDRKVAARAPITARLVAKLIEAAGIDRVLTMDLHAGQIQGFFDIPVDNLYAAGPMVELVRRELLTPDPGDTVIVSPDAGGVERARSFAQRLGCGLAILDKRREGPNVAEVLNLIGEVDGKTAILVDDMIDTAGTMAKGAAALVQRGARAVHALATHAVLSGPAVVNLRDSKFDRVVVTDTIPHAAAAEAIGRVRVLSVAPIFAEAIRAIHMDASISRLFR